MIFTGSQILYLIQQYKSGKNLTKELATLGIPVDFDAINFIYELQSGEYTKMASQNYDFIEKYVDEISVIISKYLTANSTILDCGTGESTIFIPLLERLNISYGVGVDASASRLLWAEKNAITSSVNLSLACADIRNLPLADDSVDAIITNHALEINKSTLPELIKEMHRVAKRYLFLIEPDFENASRKQKRRMNSLGYIKNLDHAIENLEYTIIEKYPLINSFNPHNKASITVVDTVKNKKNMLNDSNWIDPIINEKLFRYMGGLINTTGLWFPLLGNIPLLRKDDVKYVLQPPDMQSI